MPSDSELYSTVHRYYTTQRLNCVRFYQTVLSMYPGRGLVLVKVGKKVVKSWRGRKVGEEEAGGMEGLGRQQLGRKV